MTRWFYALRVSGQRQSRLLAANCTMRGGGGLMPQCEALTASLLHRVVCALWRRYVPQPTSDDGVDPHFVRLTFRDAKVSLFSSSLVHPLPWQRRA